jgi:hypothetical protein
LSIVIVQDMLIRVDRASTPAWRGFVAGHVGVIKRSDG